MKLDRPLNLDFSISEQESSGERFSCELSDKEVAEISRSALSGTLSDRSKPDRIIESWVKRLLKERSLTYMADCFGSDKGFRKHLYTTVYQEFIIPGKVRSLLELGLLCHDDQKKLGGGESFSKAPSLDMWSAYLPDADIYGFDIKDFSNAKGEWKYIVKGDQSDRKDLARMIALHGLYDVIIDDALHASRHQQVSFSYLFQYVRKGGLFIIEDLHYQPFIEADEVTTKALLKRLQKEGAWSSKHATSEEAAFIEANVENIQFFDSMRLPRETSRDALCVITKK